MDQTELDQAVSILADHKDEWARLPVSRKRALLIGMRRKTAAVAGAWVQAAVEAKGIAGQPTLAVEEWLGGPYAVLLLLNELGVTLGYIEKGQTRPLKRILTRPDGQTVVDVFPLTNYDRILFMGMRGEVWMQPGVTAANIAQSMAVFYKRISPQGKVALVLGAGNVASIAVADVLYKLFVEGQVCLLKMNPVNSYLGVFFKEIFGTFCRAGYVHFAYGGADVGAYLCNHADVDEIHVTGGVRTHDAIVYGTSPDAAERKRLDRPTNTRRVTSELGCVTPTIVVPGPWTEADLRYQAEHIATQKYNNAGYNCLATQVLITSAEWDKTPALLDAIRAVIQRVPQRPSYYPGTAERYRSVLDAHPDAEVLDPVAHPDAEVLDPVGDTRGNSFPRVLVSGLDPGVTDDVCFTQECFGGVLSETRLPGTSPVEFLRHAVRFANERLAGTLSANVIIHPQTAKEMGPALEEAIADLRYGSIGVNAWTAYGFLLPMLTWGAFPGHTRNAIESGIGVVHNSFMFDSPQKSVLYGPFRVRPKPPFVTNRNGDELGRQMVAFEGSRSVTKLPGVILAALKG